MATTRFNLIQWVDDTTTVDRTQFNDAFASIDNLGAGYTQSTGAPAAASADKVGFVHFNTTDETLFYCDGTDWHQINVFGNTTDATISAITPGDSKAAGSSTELAKADHVHQMPAFGTIANLAQSATSTNGSATTFSRSDHTHGIPNGTITNAMLDGSITGSKIAAGTIEGSNILSTTTITADTYLVGGDDGITNVTGSYGNVQTVGSGAGGYEGYSIDGHTVFMAQSSTGTYGLYDDQNNQWSIAATRNGATSLYYNGSSKLATASGGVSVTGTVTATTFIGALSGNATSANSAGTATTATNVDAAANNSNNESTYIAFVDGATGAQRIETDTGLRYNPSSNTLTATTFSGNATSATNADTVDTLHASQFLRSDDDDTTTGRLTINNTNVGSAGSQAINILDNGSVGTAGLSFRYPNNSPVQHGIFRMSNANVHRFVFLQENNANLADIQVQAVYYNGGSFGTSDLNLKTKVGDSPGLDFVDTLMPFTGRWNADEDEKNQFFLGAQEVEESLSAAGLDPEDYGIVGFNTETGAMAMDYVQLIPVLIQAVKDLKGRLEAVEAGS